MLFYYNATMTCAACPMTPLRIQMARLKLTMTMPTEVRQGSNQVVAVESAGRIIGISVLMEGGRVVTLRSSDSRILALSTDFNVIELTSAALQSSTASFIRIQSARVPKKKSKSALNKKGSFMTDSSYDSGVDSNCVESYNNTFNGGEGTCLIDSATAHVILGEKRFFVNLESSHDPNNIKTVGGMFSRARDVARVSLTMTNGTPIDNDKAIYAPGASRS